MKKLILLIPFLCAPMFGQSATLGGTAKVGGVATIGVGIAPPTITKIASCLSSTCNFSTPYHLTTSAGSPLGSIILMAAVVNGGGVTFTTTCSDPRGNSYTGTAATQQQSTATSLVEFCYAPITTAVQSGDSLTFSVPGVDDGTWNIAVYSITAVVTSSALDQIVGNNAIGSGAETFTTSTLTPGQQPEVAIMIGCFTFGAGTFSSYGNIIGTAATGLDNFGPSARVLVTSWRHLASTTAGTAAFSVTGSSGDTQPMLFITFKTLS